MDDKRPKRNHAFKKARPFQTKPSGPKKAPAKPFVPSFSLCQVKYNCKFCPHVNETYAGVLKTKYEHQLSLLRQASSISKARVITPVEAPKELAYKTSTEIYAVASNKHVDEEEPYSFQLYGIPSRGLYDIDYCPIHTKTIGQFVRKLKKIFDLSGLEPINENPETGNFRYIEVRSSHLTDELMLVFHVTKDMKAEIKRLITRLRSMELRIISAFMCIECEGSEPTYTRIAGVDKLREGLCDLNFEISPQAAFEANPWQKIQIMRRVEQIADVPPPNSYAWDVYGRNAQYGMLLARAGYQTYTMEQDDVEAENAKINIKKNNLEEKNHLLQDSIGNFAIDIPEKAQQPLMIIANTPTKGMDLLTKERLVDVLRDSKHSKLVYMSSNVPAMMEDLEKLSTSGKTVRQIEAFDIEPQGNRILWLAVLA